MNTKKNHLEQSLFVKDYSLQLNCECSPKNAGLKPVFITFVSFLAILINFDEPDYFLGRTTNFITTVEKQT